MIFQTKHAVLLRQPLTKLTRFAAVRPSSVAAVTPTPSATAAAETKPPHPPFTRETAIQKIRMAEDAWNSRDPDRVKMAYTVDSRWRNRNQFVTGRDEIKQLLTVKWKREAEYRLIKELWAYEEGGNRIAVRFAYEYREADTGRWYRAYGNENWEFDDAGLMRERHASINDLAIEEEDRKFHWNMDGPRPLDHPGLSDLGL